MPIFINRNQQNAILAAVKTKDVSVISFMYAFVKNWMFIYIQNL